MYNGLESLSIKGTGLSGYVQRSRASVITRGVAQPWQSSQTSSATNTNNNNKAVSGEADGSGAFDEVRGINPLLQRRSAAENESAAQRLNAHNALRQVKLKVLLYTEERRAAGMDESIVSRESNELYKTLKDAALRALKREQKSRQVKSAERFASAFGVRPNDDADAFDRVVQEQRRAEAEVERRKQVEAKLVERVKRIRQEEGL